MGNKASSSGSICRILVIGSKSGDDCLTELSKLPPQALIMATGNTLEELIEHDDGNDFRECNVVFNGIISFLSSSLSPLLHHY
jgi:hypothetical protein